MKTADQFWASFFGLNVSEYLSPEPKIAPHAGLHNYHGIWLFRRQSQVIVSAPAELVVELSEMLRKVNHLNGWSDEVLIEKLGHRVQKVIGPAFQGFLAEPDFQPIASFARLLQEDDALALAALRAACDEEEWEHSDIEIGKQPLFGCFTDDRLIAVATYRVALGVAAFPGLITHPDFRGRGYGKAVLSRAIAHALDHELLPLYQTLMANKAAIAVAQSLGYQHYATHLAVRLR